MPLSQGFRLGPYEILTPLGAGGMGEVYKARDTRLGRTVAVKVLPDHLTSPEARERLAREAQAISALSHSHICALYDVGRERATDYLVMEFLEGETLADRISRGALPLAQTLRFGGEIASALEAAHRRGIAHRDLKPANVMLTKSGVKLLDFGLARILKPGGPVANHTSADTEANELTREGTILGTLAYMAPEQIEGKPADARTDIFALGIVLYEMATGKKAFSGTSQALLLSSVLTAEPPAISSRRPDSPAALDRLVRFCLSKDPADRWQSAHDLALELGSIEEDASQAAVPDARTSRNRNRERLAWLVAGTLFVALVAGRFRGFGRAGEALQVTRFLVASPEKSEFFRHPSSNSLALSPDGSSLAFIASTAGTTSLWVRRVDALAAVRLNGTEEAIGPFWSPDGRWLGFFARGKLQKIAVAGGPPQALCDIADGNAATWGRDGTILFAEWEGGREGIQRVSAEGGRPRRSPSSNAPAGSVLMPGPCFYRTGTISST